MPTTREIHRLNDLLGAELGRNPYGQPMYMWKFSEHERRQKVVCGPNNKPIFDWVKNEAGVLVPKPRLTLGMAWDWLRDQWVVTKWCFSTLEEWTQAFGELLPWPDRGYYHPTNAKLSPGEHPDLGITQEFIGMCRRERENTFSDYMRQSEDGLKREEKQQEEQLDGTLGEFAPAFDNPYPGKRSGHVSLPSPEFAVNPVIPASPGVR